MNKDTEQLLQERYYTGDEKCWADICSSVGKIYPPFERLMLEEKACPSSPTLMNANLVGGKRGTLSSCFPLSIGDSKEEIFEGAICDAGYVTSAGGGCGWDFSYIRSKGEIIKSIGKPTGGVIPFIFILNSVLENMRQGGREKGAAAGELIIHHPDIYNFIRIKKNYKEQKLKRFNLSVDVTDKFYKDLKEKPNETFLVQEVISKKWKPLLNDKGKEFTNKTFWETLVHYSWLSAEPGISNKDTAVKRCTTTNIDSRVVPNPCHEFIHNPNTSCSLLSFSLPKYMLEDKTFDWKTFRDDVHIGTDMLNHVIDKNYFPLQKIEDATLNVRPIGMGYMGLATILMKMEIPFNSKEASIFRQEITRFMTFASMERSIELSKKDGPYPAYDKDTYIQANARFFDNMDEEIHGIFVKDIFNNLITYGIRNSSNTSIAPTGSISGLYEVSGGLEPEFALSYSRKIENADGTFRVIYISNKIFEEFINKHYKDKVTDILEYVSKNEGSCQGNNIMSKEHQKIFIVARDMTPMEHLESLADVELNVSLSASKTINLPKDATEKQISEVFIKAHNMGIIGVSVYRDGCREGILHTGNEAKLSEHLNIKTFEEFKLLYTESHKDEEEIIKKDLKLPNKSVSETFTLKSEGKKFYITVTYFDGTFKPFATFINTNHTIKTMEIKNVVNDLFNLAIEKGISDKIINVQKEKIKDCNNIDKFSRSLSLTLRHGINISNITKVLDNSKTGLGMVFRISKFLKTFLEGNNIAGNSDCPKCGEKKGLIHIGGCIECKIPSCTYYECG
jgi:ribonucleoside-diphosphate reductase alpha chain